MDWLASWPFTHQPQVGTNVSSVVQPLLLLIIGPAQQDDISAKLRSKFDVKIISHGYPNCWVQSLLPLTNWR